MPQPVVVNTESILSVASKKPTSPSGSTDVTPFAVELDKHIKPENPQTKQTEPATVDTEKAAEPEQKLAADGNNLPAEDDSAPSEDVVAETVNDVEASETDVTEDQPPIEEVAIETDVDLIEDIPVEAKTHAPEETEAEAVVIATEPVTTEKPIRAQVTVSQQAVDHAKAAPVEMTAKEAPQQPVKKVETEIETPTIPKTDTARIDKSDKPLKAEIPAVIVSAKTQVESQSVDKPGLPNLASTMKLIEQEADKTPRIRADILDALQRQQGKQEVTANVRNVMANQAAQQMDKPSVDMINASLQRPASDNTPHPLTTLTGVSGLSQSTSATTQTPGATTTLVSLPIQPNMHSAAWNQVMTSRVVWMAREGVQEAQLRMNPANLGPVEVKLHIQNDQASVTFLAQHSATRDALEQALPRLRESFAENGMELTNAQVGQQEQQHQQESEQTNQAQIFTQANRPDDDIESEAIETIESVQASPVGVSVYA